MTPFFFFKKKNNTNNTCPTRDSDERRRRVDNAALARCAQAPRTGLASDVRLAARPFLFSHLRYHNNGVQHNPPTTKPQPSRTPQ